MLKPGVQLLGIRPEVAFVMPFVYDVAKRFLGGLVVTSACDGQHMRGSHHYKGCAIDIRTRTAATPEHIDAAVELLRDELGPDFDVVRETDHIHLEFDPKGD